MLERLTLYFPYYNQPEALHRQLKCMSTYHTDIRERLIIMIVDDGSQEHPAFDEIDQKYCLLLDIVLLRIDIDIPWNTPEANNFAFREMQTEFSIRTDIDHLFPEDSLRHLLQIQLQTNRVYKFKRVEQGTNNPLKSPPNIYLLSCATYKTLNGYNEYFSGNYGDDIEFLPRLYRQCVIELLDIHTIVDTTHSTRTLPRDISINRRKLDERNRPHYTFRHSQYYKKLLEGSYPKRK